METETKNYKKNGNENLKNLKRKLINLAVSILFLLYFHLRDIDLHICRFW